MNIANTPTKLGAPTIQPTITALLKALDEQANTVLGNLKNIHVSLDGPAPEPSEALPPPQQGSLALAQDINRVLDMCIHLSSHILEKL